jgi:hypothetical protein
MSSLTRMATSALPTTARSMTEAQVDNRKAHGIMPCSARGVSDALRLGGLCRDRRPLAGDWQATRAPPPPPLPGFFFGKDIRVGLGQDAAAQSAPSRLARAIDPIWRGS